MSEVLHSAGLAAAGPVRDPPPAWPLALLVLISACAVKMPPKPPPPGSPSVQRLMAGPFAVATREVTFVDPEPPGADAPRTLVTTLWFPRDAQGSHPLVVYSHGLESNRFRVGQDAQRPSDDVVESGVRSGTPTGGDHGRGRRVLRQCLRAGGVGARGYRGVSPPRSRTRLPGSPGGRQPGRNFDP
jgi:hypothetical protein